MGGVGSFEKDCRTLYVGRLGNNYDLESDLWSEFSEWGEIEVWYTYFIPGKLVETRKQIRGIYVIFPRKCKTIFIFKVG